MKEDIRKFLLVEFGNRAIALHTILGIKTSDSTTVIETTNGNYYVSEFTVAQAVSRINELIMNVT